MVFGPTGMMTHVTTHVHLQTQPRTQTNTHTGRQERHLYADNVDAQIGNSKWDLGHVTIKQNLGSTPFTQIYTFFRAVELHLCARLLVSKHGELVTQ